MDDSCSYFKKDSVMDIIEAVKLRKSVRDFKSDPVSKKILNEILQIASRAPSAENSQPWEFTVITGGVLANVSRANIDQLNAGIFPEPEYTAVKWPPDSIYRQRQIDIAKQLFKLMDIPRGDTQKRARWTERGFRYFNAPAAIIITMDRSLPASRPLLDIGAVMQTICLVALHYDLGSCISNQGVMYPEILRQFAGIPASQQIITSIAIGYPNRDFPANAVESAREPIENITHWQGKFDT